METGSRSSNIETFNVVCGGENAFWVEGGVGGMGVSVTGALLEGVEVESTRITSLLI